MSTILSPLVERLRQFNLSQLEAIAVEAGVAKTLPRKLACGDRTNPTIQTVEPLIEYFRQVDEGARALPFEPTPTTQEQSHG